MKIIEAISDTNIGGAGILLITRLMSDKSMREKTVVVIPTESMLGDRLKNNEIDFLEVDGCRDRSFDIRAVFKYAKIIKRLSPDIVNCHGCLSFRIAAFICGVPIRIYTRHCAFPLKQWQKKFVARFLLGKVQGMLSNGIIAVADSAKKNLTDMGIAPKKIKVIINGVSGFSHVSKEERLKTKSSLGIPDGTKVIGIFARLEQYKGHIDLINAAEILIKKSVNYRFLIVGDGSLREKLESECRRRGLEGYVIFTGFAENVSDYFNITDINVNCSSGTETSSLALSEGMSLGIPAVASDYGGNCYMIQDGINGLIYPTGDFKALADCIYSLNDYKLYEKLSSGAYKRFKVELNSKQMADSTYSYYRHLYNLKFQASSNI